MLNITPVVKAQSRVSKRNTQKFDASFVNPENQNTMLP
jgi:hypothetical protein